jgi:hypothetical protein
MARQRGCNTEGECHEISLKIRNIKKSTPTTIPIMAHIWASKNRKNNLVLKSLSCSYVLFLLLTTTLLVIAGVSGMNADLKDMLFSSRLS